MIKGLEEFQSFLGPKQKDYGQPRAHISLEAEDKLAQRYAHLQRARFARYSRAGNEKQVRKMLRRLQGPIYGSN